MATRSAGDAVTAFRLQHHRMVKRRRSLSRKQDGGYQHKVVNTMLNFYPEHKRRALRQLNPEPG
jgi:hypothetical protein